MKTIENRYCTGLREFLYEILLHLTLGDYQLRCSVQISKEAKNFNFTLPSNFEIPYHNLRKHPSFPWALFRLYVKSDFERYSLQNVIFLFYTLIFSSFFHFFVFHFFLSISL